MMAFLRKRNRRGERDALAPVSRWVEPATGGRLAAMRHPLFLGALAVLVINDHLLKGAGVLPGVVTGKLSDFAGLVVAPVLVAAALGARSRRARAAAFAAVAAPFAAIKLSAAAANVLVAAAALVGLRFRIWQDPTDLLAFVALWPAWRLSARAADTVAEQGVFHGARAAWWAERGVLAGAAAACVATSQAPPGYVTDSYLVNYSGQDVDVRVRWVDAKLDCPRVMAGDPGRLLGPNAFNLGITFRLAAGATVPLNRADAFEASGQGDINQGVGGTGGILDPGTGGVGDPGTDKPGTGGSCEVALIETDGTPATIVFWDGLDPVSIPTNVLGSDRFWDNPELARGRVVIVQGAVATPGEVKQAPLQRTVEDSSCPIAAQVAYQWSVPGGAIGVPVYLHEVGELPDGCVEMAMGYYPTDAEDPTPDMKAYLCIPTEEFPFAAGTKVDVSDNGTRLEIRDSASSKTLAVLHDASEFDVSGLSASVKAGDCEGDRLSCGAYAAPGKVAVKAGGKAQDLGPGESMSGADFRVRVGRAEYVIVGREQCEAGYDVPSLTADFLVSYQ